MTVVARPLSIFFSRSIPLIAALALLAATAPASAQTTIHLTTTTQGYCDAVTDVNGVTLASGSTALQASGVTLTGPGCGGGTPPPTSNNQLALTATPSAPAAGDWFDVSWQVINASTCVGTVTGGTAANVSGWAEVNTPASPRRVTISAAGMYALTLTCSNAGNPTNLVSPSLPLTVGTASTCTVPGLSRLMTSDISYGYAPAVRTGVDVTEWSGIWGHWSATDATQPWPGFAVAGTVTTIRQFGRHNFVAAHFNTGTNGGTVRGNYVFPSNFPGPNIDMSVSTTCGDFNPNGANPACLATNIVSADSFFLYWNFSGGSPNFECQMQPNTDYYTNIRLTDPNSAMECAVGNPICPITTSMQANH